MPDTKRTVTKAYVVAERGGPFELRDVVLDGLQPNEVLVEIKYTGLCHTDLVVQQGGMPIGGYPVVLGHEGLGTVRGVGSSVSGRSLKEGDTVVLSFHTCRQCRGCLEKRYGSCSQMTETNFINPGRKSPGATSPISLPDGAPVFGQFFGQSSFSKMAVVCENSVVKISAKPQDLVFLAPLACGYLTGAGTVLNVLRPHNNSKVAVLGMGAVGLAAMLAAKAIGVEHLVAVDLVDEKLQLAESLGATHIIDTSTGQGLNAAIRDKFPDGVDYIIDTTGVATLLQASVQALSHEGTLALVGVPQPTATIQVNALDLLLSCKRIVGIIEGFSNPQELIPELLKLYYSDKFPIDRISKCYPAEDLNKAIQDLKAGRVIKPVLSWQNISQD
ncbi:PKS-ER domain-containing protein [Fusarium keratoplasticum]|uniref:PKS-ER domain-containing protein n=1 Tax=Fusarium keratoplasticum TaxID=1328300 RepID=A0ACC0RAF5_9HYPO|nr:PKS-ER domain-containing protein [Fusarium keratoplasticum]KAI8680421.1 PKS-ER domain-containing protein [Fusarium keratoplasticum]KAI8686484.1 PKS-ER domain-containing protein [Fusarium keratoplasticum]